MANRDGATIATADILRQRGAVYGHPTPNLAATEEVWQVIEKYWRDEGIAYSEREQMELDAMKAAMKMVAFKMMRIVCGRKDHWDNYDDVRGYLTIAEDRAHHLFPPPPVEDTTPTLAWTR